MTGGSSGGSGGCGGRRPGADRARLRHQRLDPRAVLVLRPVRPQADLWPAVARRHLPVRGEPRSCGPARPLARAIWRSPTMPCRATTPSDPVCAERAAEPALPLLERGHRRPAHRGRRRLFRSAARRPRRLAAVARVAKALGATREIEIPRSRRARGPRPIVITTSEGARAASRSPAHARRRFRSRRARPADRGRHGAGIAGGQGAEIPPLVSRARCSTLFDERGRHPGAGDAVAPRRASASRRSMLDGRRGAAAAQHRHLHAADLLHRPAGGRRAGAARRRCRSACRSSPRPGARTWRCASRTRCRNSKAVLRAAAPSRNWGRIGGEPWTIDLPEVVAEVRAAFERYEQALVTQRRGDARCAVPPRSSAPIRYGVGENLYGHKEIARLPRRALAGRPGAHDLARR